jgi:hypothetical protein
MIIIACLGNLMSVGKNEEGNYGLHESIKYEESWCKTSIKPAIEGFPSSGSIIDIQCHDGSRHTLPTAQCSINRLPMDK